MSSTTSTPSPQRTNMTSTQGHAVRTTASSPGQWSATLSVVDVNSFTVVSQTAQASSSLVPTTPSAPGTV